MVTKIVSRLEAFGSRLVSPKARVIIQAHEYFLMIVVAMVVLRIPNLFEPYWYGDEGIYLTLGQAMGRGIPLYAGIIDHKTPLIYVWAMLAQTLTMFKVQLLLVSVVSVGLFYLLASWFLRKRRTVLLATLIFMLLTTLPTFEGNIANGELFLMPFILAGVWLLVRRWPHKDDAVIWSKAVATMPAMTLLGVGMLMAVGLLTKVPSGFDFGAMGVWWLLLLPMVWRTRGAGGWLKKGVMLVVGFLIPIGLSVLYFALRGELAAYFDFGLLYNFRYIEAWNQSFTNPIGQFLVSMLGRLLVLVLLLVGTKWLLGRERMAIQFTFVWFGMTLFASMLSLRPYPHYFIQIMPPVAILLGHFWEESWRVRAGVMMMGLMVGLIFWSFGFARYPTLPYYGRFARYLTHQISWQTYANGFDAHMLQTERLADWIRQHTAVDERIFIWGNEPNTYALSRRSPVGRYTVAFHIQSFGSYAETIHALEEYKPRYIIDALQDPESFDQLYWLLAAEYTVYDQVGEAVVYRRLGS